MDAASWKKFPGTVAWSPGASLGSNMPLERKQGECMKYHGMIPYDVPTRNLSEHDRLTQHFSQGLLRTTDPTWSSSQGKCRAQLCVCVLQALRRIASGHPASAKVLDGLCLRERLGWLRWLIKGTRGFCQRQCKTRSLSECQLHLAVAKQ